ncbi:hypothetical protein H0H87_006789, partial [Tephrocybe sp. NHM501043]
EPLDTTFGAGNLAKVKSLLNSQPEGLSTALWVMHKEALREECPLDRRLHLPRQPWLMAHPPSPGIPWLRGKPRNLDSLTSNRLMVSNTPKIVYNFFQNPVDLYIMAAGVQQIVSTPPISDNIVTLIAPAAGVTSIEDLSEYIEEQAGYTNHIIGTALLAPRGDGSVVDPKLEVYGTKNVFAVDASVTSLQASAHSRAVLGSREVHQPLPEKATFIEAIMAHPENANEKVKEALEASSYLSHPIHWQLDEKALQCEVDDRT